MSHFSTYVLVPDKTQGVSEEVTRLLARYDENIKGEPERVYMDVEDIERMAKHYKLKAEPKALVGKMEAWHGSEGFIDEGGLHYISTYNQESKWDWWQIGGRWSGALDGYNPNKDPDNLEVCHTCGGTGKRDDKLGRKQREKHVDYTCNRCDGTGKRVKWPTEWAHHDGDIALSSAVVGAIRAGKVDFPYAMVSPDGSWHHKGDMGWFGTSRNDKDEKAWREEVIALLSHGPTLVVVCDLHI